MARMAMGRSDPANMAAFRTQMRENPEDLWQPQYDRVNYPAAGTNEIAFFSIPLGGSATLIRAGVAAAVVKSYRDTNLEQQGVIPTKAFQIHGFSMSLYPLQTAVAVAGTQSIVDDMQRLTNGGFLEFFLIDKPYIRLPLSKLPGTGIMRGTAAGAFTAGNVAVAGGGHGTGDPRAIYWLGVPLTIDPYQSFRARMQFDGVLALVQTFDIQLFLEGYLRRPGQ